MPASQLQCELELHKTKNRIAAVDIVRILAAFAVMYGHLSIYAGKGSFSVCLTSIFGIFGGPYSAIFFVFAGYFACRKITWKKALDNAFWCFAPFILWNSTAILAHVCFSSDYYNISDLLTPEIITDLYGFGQIYDIIQTGEYFSGEYAANSPLWFMRDLVFLFLLSPILFRYAKTLFPILIILSLIPQTHILFKHNPFIVFSPYSILFFVSGCFVRSLPDETQKKVLKFYSPTLIIIYVSVTIATWIWHVMGHRQDAFSFPPTLKSLLSLWMLYQIARYLEENSRFIVNLALKIAPVTFLTFATHMMAFSFVRMVCPSLYQNSLATLILPVVLFAFLTLVFEAMKKWCRPLLHLAAHYKLRPDDLKPESQSHRIPPVSSVGNR